MLKIFISSVQKEFVTERAAGGRAPEFRQSGGQFVQTLWRPKAAISAQNDRPSRPIQSGNGPVKAHDEAHEAHDESQSQGKADSRPTQSATQSPTQSDDPVTRLLSVLRRGTLSPQALRLSVGLTHRQTFRMNYLRPALKAGFIERTIPGKPTSRLQKYQLTAKGRAWLAAHRKEIKDT